MGVRGTELPVAMRELLDHGGVIVTGNARAARALDRRYAEAMLREACGAWRTPKILDLLSWLTDQWGALLLTGTEDRLLLNQQQEEMLWRRIIDSALKQRSLLDPARMASLAQQAYRLLADYGALGRLAVGPWATDLSAEPEAFRQWARSFEQQCKRNRWLPQCDLIDAVTQAFRWGMLPAPKQIAWVGFDRWTPAELALRTALEARGVEEMPLAWEAEQAAAPRLYRAQDEVEETAACAAWIRERLERDRRARIGVLMPDLGRRRAGLERDLYAILSPEKFPITAGAAPVLPFEFSLGQPLADVPLVHAALLLLRWLRQPLAQQEISWLLLSGTLSAGQGPSARDALAHLDLKLRTAKCAPPEMSLDAFLRQPFRGAPPVNKLLDQLAAMRQSHRSAQRIVDAGEWMRRIQRLLQAAGWGERADASSLTYQSREAWGRLLDAVASLNFAHARFEYEEILATLERAAREQIFSPESADAPVQAMGAYAAAGQAFDAVWFLGATDTDWPASGGANPLLPLALQRELGMPHASATEDAALAHRTTENILRSSRECVFSFALLSGETTQRPSPLVGGLQPAQVFTRPPSLPVPLEPADDELWVPLAHTVAVQGGTSALQRQAECPFQAFVFHRLRAKDLPTAGRGLSPGDRGTLIHTLLEYIWSRDNDARAHLTSHSELHAAMADGTLHALVTAHAPAAIRKLQAAQAEPWQRAYLKAEEDRAIELVLDWLRLESKRQPFHVLAVEERAEIQVGALSLSVRADRIDRVAGGDVLIDYKTGEVSTSSWEGPRPEQPQLPLYAAFGSSRGLVGALFAQIRRKQSGFKGRIDDPRANLTSTLDAKDPLLASPFTPALVEEWRATLLRLADDFAHGVALIDPHFYPKSCRYCPLGGVCRVREQRGAGAPQESDPAEGAL